MKNFKDLSIGDEIFFIDVKKSFDVYKDEYGYVRNDGEVRGAIIINQIALVEDFVYINPTFEYGKVKSCPVKFSLDRFNKSNVLRQQTDGYNGVDRILFANEVSQFNIVKNMVLREIYKKEQEIISYKNSLIGKIGDIRQKYWDVLNPSLKTINNE